MNELEERVQKCIGLYGLTLPREMDSDTFEHLIFTLKVMEGAHGWALVDLAGWVFTNHRKDPLPYLKELAHKVGCSFGTINNMLNTFQTFQSKFERQELAEAGVSVNACRRLSAEWIDDGTRRDLLLRLKEGMTMEELDRELYFRKNGEHKQLPSRDAMSDEYIFALAEEVAINDEVPEDMRRIVRNAVREALFAAREKFSL